MELIKAAAKKAAAKKLGISLEEYETLSPFFDDMESIIPSMFSNIEFENILLDIIIMTLLSDSNSPLSFLATKLIMFPFA